MTVRDRIAVDEGNQAQLDAWDGTEGSYWAAHADEFDRAVVPHHARLMEAAAVAATERVLDLGCGAGETTLDAARAAHRGSAVGVDLSADLLAVARQRAEAGGVANAAFLQADAQVHPFEPASFDVAVSRTGAMFFADPHAAFANVARALSPGGRLVLVAWQGFGANEWFQEITGALAAGRDLQGPPPGAPGPFALSEPERVRAVLEGAGFGDVALEGFEAPMWFGTDADHAHRFILGLMGWMLEELDDDRREQARSALHGRLAAHETPGGVLLGSGAWLITATRR